ncbi:MAG: 1-(5-phosphoribosyl)-5-[Clostridia bacterium]|nr:1-(5-phosphoribosyl)-5-[(5-phosphoribosylamino)methylideneamino]imidazole-4-carboxamide isomerase [Clostridia bacterium]
MKIFPAIDLFDGKAVRLLRGKYEDMTVYSNDPPVIATDFKRAGAECMHLVDLEGAKCGGTPNLETVKSILSAADMFVEVGGGVRTMDVIEAYTSAGVSRVILGTAAVTDRDFLLRATDKYREKIAVGVDIRDGRVAIKGWTETSELNAFDFCRELEKIGVGTVICTDISKDGAMQGTNRELYRDLSHELGIDIVASGGVSTLDDVRALREMDIYGAIIGKAYYTGAISLSEAIRMAK